MIPIYVQRKIKRLFTFHAEEHRNTIKNKAKYSLSNRKQALQCYASAVPCRMLEDKVENSFITWSVPKTAIVSRDNRFL